MNWPTFLSGVALAVPLAAALIAIAGRYWADKILEEHKAKYLAQMETLLADLRTRDTKELFVHKVQFEKEFRVYEDLWKQALELGRAGGPFGVLFQGQPKTIDSRVDLVADAHSKLQETVFGNRPFYSPAVFDAAKKLLDALLDVVRMDWKRNRLEGRESRNDSDVEKLIDLGDSIEAKLNGISELVVSLCDRIRERVWNTNKSGWDRVGEGELESSESA